jgi:hypothetical protein
MIKIEIDLDFDIDTLDRAIETLEDCKLRIQTRNDLEEIKRKNRKKKKTVDELLMIVDEELLDFKGDLEDATVSIADLTLKKEILEKKKSEGVSWIPPIKTKHVRTIKKVIPILKEPEVEIKTQIEGTVRFLIDEAEKRTQMDKEMFKK